MRRFLTSRGVPACAGLGLTAVAAAALLAGCSSASKTDPYKIGTLPAADVVAKGHTAGHWTRDGGTLELVGTVTPDSAAQFATALGSAAATTVRVTVTGGDLASGLAIGRTIHDRKLNLLIDGAWNLYLIDHSRAFLDDRSLPQVIDHVDADLWSKISGLDESALQNAVGTWLTRAQIQSMVARRAKLEASIDALVKKNGRSTVFAW